MVATLTGCAKDAAEPPLLAPDTAASRGYDAMNQGDALTARSYFELALEADPENSYARLGLDMLGDDVADDPAVLQRVATIPDRIPEPVAEIVAEAVPAVAAPEPIASRAIEPATVVTVEPRAPVAAAPPTYAAVPMPDTRARGWGAVVEPAVSAISPANWGLDP